VSRRISLDGKPFWDGVKEVVGSAEEPILGIAQGRALTFVSLCGADLVVSWAYPLSGTVREIAGEAGAFFFGIPPLIARHLATLSPGDLSRVRLAVQGSDVSLNGHDTAGEFELRWRFDLSKLAAPPELGRLLAPPESLLPTGFLRFADAVHGAVARLTLIESERQIHRTRLALTLGLYNGNLSIDACEIDAGARDHYYFDPRLVMRALEFVRSERVEVGVTPISPRRAFLSLVERRAGHVTHCALLSMDFEAQRLILPASKALSGRGRTRSD
jgi:hypothetical protein